MAKTCIRCGYERTESDGEPATECPSCGVIYERAETQQKAVAKSAQQARLAAALRSRRDRRDAHGLGGFLSFRLMIIPALVQISFVVSVLGIGLGFVIAVMSGHGMIAVASVFTLLLTRIFHEAVMVVFRLAEDVSAIRDQLEDQAIDTLRAGG